MHGICLSGGIKLSVSRAKIPGFGTAIGLTSMLATIFDLEVTKTKDSFLSAWVADTWLNGNFFGCSFNRLFDLGLGLLFLIFT